MLKVKGVVKGLQIFERVKFHWIKILGIAVYAHQREGQQNSELHPTRPQWNCKELSDNKVVKEG